MSVPKSFCNKINTIDPPTTNKGGGLSLVKKGVCLSCFLAKKLANVIITAIFTNSAGCIPSIHPFAPLITLPKRKAAVNKPIPP